MSTQEDSLIDSVVGSELTGSEFTELHEYDTLVLRFAGGVEITVESANCGSDNTRLIVRVNGEHV